MKTLNKTASEVLDTLTSGLTLEQSGRRIDNSAGTFMPVYVNYLGDNRYLVGHYFKQNGDLVPDPEMLFIKINGQWFPLETTFATGLRMVGMELDETGAPIAWRPAVYHDACSFANMWMRNIKEQQRSLEAKQAA